MKKIFIESCLKPENDIHPDKYWAWLDLLQYSHCIVETDKDKNFINEHFFKRKTLLSEKKNPMTIQNERLKNDFLVFHCLTPELTKWACQDQRIDVLTFELSQINKLADNSTINLLASNSKGIDINISSLHSRGSIGKLRNIKKVVYRAVKKKIPILLSSHVNTPDLLRSKKIMLAFSTFLGMPENYFESTCQSWLFSRLMRNRERQQGNDFISPGIWRSKTESGVE